MSLIRNDLNNSNQIKSQSQSQSQRLINTIITNPNEEKKYNNNNNNNNNSFSVKSEQMGNINLNLNEDFIYKQYKNNMQLNNNNNNTNINNNNNNLIKQKFNNINNINNNQIKQRQEIEQNISEALVPVRIKSEDKDDWIRDLNFKMQSSISNSNKQTFTLNITDNNDPLFLYLLEITESEFHSIKQEQSLLIEFQQFPNKFYEMLEMSSIFPINNNNNNNSKLDDMNLNLNFNSANNKTLIGNYVCILHHTNPTDALLIVQEITQFRQLNHLILKVKSANDTILKKYLSDLVKDYKLKTENLEKDNEIYSDNLENTTRNFQSIKEELLFINQKK
jgi:spindle assembly abnormal protein 6